MSAKTFTAAALIGLALGHDAMADDRANPPAAMGSAFARAVPHRLTTRPAATHVARRSRPAGTAGDAERRRAPPRCWLLLVLHRPEQSHARLLGSVSRTVRCGRLLWARRALDRGYGRAAPRPPGSTSAASFRRDCRQPVSLSCGRTPVGIFSHRMVTRVPSSVSAKRVVIFMSPAKRGSCDSNTTISTIFSSGTSSTNLPWKVSVSREVLPPGECAGS